MWSRLVGPCGPCGLSRALRLRVATLLSPGPAAALALAPRCSRLHGPSPQPPGPQQPVGDARWPSALKGGPGPVFSSPPAPSPLTAGWGPEGPAPTAPFLLLSIVSS